MPTTVPVTADNFTRVETDLYFGMLVKTGRRRGPSITSASLHPIEDPGVRPNRDTLYSEVVFDLDAGPVEISLPDPGDRFLSMLVIDQDHDVVMVAYGGGRHTLTKDQVGTRYVLAAVRILVDPDDPPTTWNRSMPCRMRWRPASRVPAASRSPTGTRKARSRSATRCCPSARHSRTCERRGKQGRGRSGPAPDRHRGRVGPQPRQGRHLPERDPQRQRWQRRLPADLKGSWVSG